jgi:hypothetical protein
MIPVALAPEPAEFDELVRRPGLSAIDQLVGRPPRYARQGKTIAKVCNHETAIPSKDFPPYWRETLPQLHSAYAGLCAYLALYIDRGTGLATADHATPKSMAWDKVYEWSNLRLCAHLINSQKGALLTWVDPFEMDEGWFTLNPWTMEVERSATAPASAHAAIDATLPALNNRDCVQQRTQYAAEYWHGAALGGLGLPYLVRRAPFVAQELRRQNLVMQVNTECFQLNPVTGALLPHPNLALQQRPPILCMLATLNQPEPVRNRLDCLSTWTQRAELRIHAPFLAAELDRLYGPAV